MNKYYMTWDEVKNRLAHLDLPEIKIYGVPNGGMIASAYLKYAQTVTDPSEATIILDDIIDSGKTRSFYENKYHGKNFVAIIDKTILSNDDPIKNAWVIFPWESQHPNGEQNIQDNIVRQLQYLGEDINREGLIDTPKRVVKSWNELYAGYNMVEEDLFTTFEKGKYDQIILLKSFEFYSTCEHHMLPFYGKAHVAYIPRQRVVGISKLARLVDMYSKRLQIQERIGNQVTDALNKHLNPLGAACVLEASHFCMRARGVNKQNSIMTTSSITGAFKENPAAKEELLQLIRQ